MKYIFFDIDGTLLENSKGIMKSTVEALEKARSNGHKLFINTGRSYAELGRGFERFNFDGLVCAAGSYIKIGNEIILDKFIQKEKIENLISILQELNLDYGLEGVEFTYFTDRIYKGFRKRVYEALEGILDAEQNGYEPYHYMLQPAFVRRFDDYIKNPTPIHKILVYSSDIENSNELAKRIPDEFYLIIYETFAELINKGINKSTGIKEVLKYYKADIKDSIAIGDSLNDLEMLKEAGLGIAMGNANETVKSCADIIAPHILDDGIYKVLEELQII